MTSGTARGWGRNLPSRKSTKSAVITAVQEDAAAPEGCRTVENRERVLHGSLVSLRCLGMRGTPDGEQFFEAWRVARVLKR